MYYHIIAFFAGFILDLIIGDPHWLPHPIRWIGGVISKTENRWYQKEDKRVAGRWFVLVVLLKTGVMAAVLLSAAYILHPYSGVCVETIMTYQILATKCLKVESMRVYSCLAKGSLSEARKAVSMIVGRDTEQLDEEGVTKAAVETIAENTSDGVIAPMLFLMLGGPVLGFLYKAVNTMDSMVGYKNDRYMEFGRCAARLDDVVNYIPARVSAWLMILAAFLSGRQYHGRQAYRIFKRDRYCHASPNSAQTEAVCAGALGVQLAGPASYFGKQVDKPFIGDADRRIEKEDIKRANHLLYETAWLCEAGCMLILVLCICL